VGLVKVQARPRLVIGKPAPDFSATTLDGNKPIKLSDYRGKYVVLKLWYNWNKLAEQGPTMKAIGEAIQNDPQWVVINVSFGDTPQVYKKSLVDGGVPGVHAVATHEQFPNAYTSWPFDLCLIDPEGKVLERDLRLENAERRVGQIMLEAR
jgi:hypothetical protein